MPNAGILIERPAEGMAMKSHWVSPMLRRILLVNLLPLVLLLAALLYLDQYQNGLLRAEVTTLREQARIFAAALGEAAVRDDGTAHHVVELAERKAYTARIFRQTTREFVERIINNPRSQGLKDTKGALASFGGVPIKVGDDTIGGVGVSGAPGGQNDEACAAAGIAKAADLLK